jgi:beta-galactosidase
MRRSVTHDVNAYRSDSLRVNVYSREKRVRLLVNGKVIGEKDINPDNFTASFWVAYEPGELKAEIVGKVKNGMPTSISFHTAKAPAAIQVQPLKPSITASHNDLAYIYIDVVDEDGNLCPTAEQPLKVETSGAKHIATCGTGHPYDMKSFRTLTPTSFRGKAVLIVQPQDEAGEVTIKVTSPNLKSAEYKLRITK